jgi:threonine/homoserine/homoserine lactone efflux protein
MDTSLIGFITMTTLASLTPGPAVLAVCGTAIGSSTRAALAQIIGTQIGNAVYAAVALLGVTLLLSAGERFFVLMQLLGAMYLFWLGFESIRKIQKPAENANQSLQASSIKVFGAIKRGLLIQLVNPKTMLYWFALLPPFLLSTVTVSGRAIQLVAIGITIDALMMALYAILIGQSRSLLTSATAARRFQLMSGVVYVLAGLLLGVRALIAS